MPAASNRVDLDLAEAAVGAGVVVQRHDGAVGAALEEYGLKGVLVQQRVQRRPISDRLDPVVVVGVSGRSMFFLIVVAVVSSLAIAGAVIRVRRRAVHGAR
eukprot:12294906-Heterocapsa_arctica.AAC.1